MVLLESSVDAEIQNLLSQPERACSNDRKREQLIEIVEPLLGPESYNAREFELASPIGNSVKDLITQWLIDLPQDESQRLFRTSPTLKRISKFQGSHVALELMYQGPLAKETGSERIWSNLFMGNSHTAMGVRNRLRTVQYVFDDHLEKCLQIRNKPINVLGIASGSSRGLLNVLADYRDHDIKLNSVDICPSALRDTEDLADQYKVGEQVKTTLASFFDTESYLPRKPFYDFVEIVGLFDYLKASDIIRLLTDVRGSLRPGGAVIYSNVMHNPEELFTHGVVGWQRMYYRGARTLRNFAINAGFPAKQVGVITEQLRMCNLIVASV